jgi:hypothetical protein
MGSDVTLAPVAVAQEAAELDLPTRLVAPSTKMAPLALAGGAEVGFCKGRARLE